MMKSARNLLCYIAKPSLILKNNYYPITLSVFSERTLTCTNESYVQAK